MEKEIGRIAHYFPRIGVAVIDVENGILRIGDTVRIRGRTTDFIQKVQSLQMEHAPVDEVPKGVSAGMKTDQEVHENDKVFVISGN